MASLERLRSFLLEKGLFAIYAVFLAGYFLLPMASGHAQLYAVSVLPAALLLWTVLRRFYHNNIIFALLLAFCSYFIASLLWTENLSLAGSLRTILYAIEVISFCAVTGYIWVHYPAKVDIGTQRLVWLAAAAALVSMLVWYSNNPFPASRLQPLGVMHHENPSASAYGAILVLATNYFFGTPRAGSKLLYYLLCGVIVALVMFTQSRTALASLCVALFVLVGYRSLGIIPVLWATSFGLLATIPGFWAVRVGEWSFRPGIWQATLERVEQHWLIGQGVLTDPQVSAYDTTFPHAHNMYLATLRDGGIIGLGLLLAMLGVAFYQAMRISAVTGERIYLALLAYGMCCIFMDFDQLLTRPRELYLFFWAPLALVMAVYQYHPALQQLRARGLPS